MLKKIFGRMASGFAATLAVVLPLEIVLSALGMGPVSQAFAARFAHESTAILVQLVLIGMIGMAFSGASAIFEIAHWSYLKQGIIHFLITAAVWGPVAVVCWTPIPAGAMAMCIGGWALTYAINWLIQYCLYRHRVRALNETIQNTRRLKEHEHEGD